MANDDRRTDHFIREVDEELRRDQLKALWTRFGPYFIGVCVLIVLITAGYRGWLWWEARQAAQAGDRFMAALEELQSGDAAKGEAELNAIIEEGGGYAVLARLRLAGAKAAADDAAAAIALYDAVAADTSVSQATRDLATVRAALLALDTGDLAGAKERVAPLNVAGNPWRHSAREVLGMAAYQSGELQAARDYFTEIQEDAETPRDLWSRSALMIALIDGQLAPPEQQADAATGEEPADAAEQDSPAGSETEPARDEAAMPEAEPEASNGSAASDGAAEPTGSAPEAAPAENPPQ
jgi:hypothetical protein